MKRLLLFFLIITRVVYGQTPEFYSESFNERNANIAGGEMRAHLRLGASPQDSAFTVASKNFNVHYYRCEWQIDPAIKYIKGKITSGFTVTELTNSISFDLSKKLTADSVLYHGNPIMFIQTDSHELKLQLPSTLEAGDADSVTIYYQGIPDASGFGSFYQGAHSGTPVIWTLSEPYGAREWWPCKNGLSDKADSMDIIIINPAAYTSSTNGVRISETVNEDWNTAVFHHRYPIATYLVAIAITNYTVEKDSIQMGDRLMPIFMYSYPEFTTYYRRTFRDVKNCLSKFSELFGPYPFAKEHYSQTVFGWNGGMEHQTNSFIGSGWDQLVAHELGHQWFGNKVTCGSWADLWLNEGFASYMQYIYVQNFDTGFRRSHLLNLITNITSEPGGSLYVTDTTTTARLFSGRLTYNKGAYVVHMLRWMLGDDVFFNGSRRYLNDPAIAYGFARTDDLKRNLEAESGKELDEFFQNWIYGEGYPDYEVEWEQNQNNWVTVIARQTTSHPSVFFYKMPVELRFRGQGQERSFVIDHQYSGQAFQFKLPFKVDTLMIDPELWILSKNKTSRKNEDDGKLNEVLAFPNPAPDVLNISIRNPTDNRLSVQLFTSTGQLVYQAQKNLPGSNERLTISMQRFAKGVYWLRITGNGKISLVKKIVRP